MVYKYNTIFQCRFVLAYIFQKFTYFHHCHDSNTHVGPLKQNKICMKTFELMVIMFYIGTVPNEGRLNNEKEL